MDKQNKLVIFEDKSIRRIWHNNEWCYSIIDIVWALTDSVNPRDYWYKMKIREEKESEVQLSTICLQLKLKSPDWKMRLTDCVNTKSAFRLIQSIPSKKAEPFKMWLAQVWKDRIDEIEDPELAQERMKQIYEQKGYSKDWIDKRLRWIAIRQNLTDEWKDRWIEDQRDYAILTAEISKATFGMTPSEYKEYKNLKKENLRDHMTDLELIFNMLWEKVTTEISTQEKPNTFIKSKKVANRWWAVAGKARKDTEKELWRSVIDKKNYLSDKENTKRIWDNK